MATYLTYCPPIPPTALRLLAQASRACNGGTGRGGSAALRAVLRNGGLHAAACLPACQMPQSPHPLSRSVSRQAVCSRFSLGSRMENTVLWRWLMVCVTDSLASAELLAVGSLPECGNPLHETPTPTFATDDLSTTAWLVITIAGSRHRRPCSQARARRHNAIKLGCGRCADARHADGPVRCITRILNTRYAFASNPATSGPKNTHKMTRVSLQADGQISFTPSGLGRISSIRCPDTTITNPRHHHYVDSAKRVR